MICNDFDQVNCAIQGHYVELCIIRVWFISFLSRNKKMKFPTTNSNRMYNMSVFLCKHSVINKTF